MVQFNFTYGPGISVEQRTGSELAARIWGVYLSEMSTMFTTKVAVNETMP